MRTDFANGQKRTRGRERERGEEGAKTVGYPSFKKPQTKSDFVQKRFCISACFEGKISHGRNIDLIDSTVFSIYHHTPTVTTIATGSKYLGKKLSCFNWTFHLPSLPSSSNEKQKLALPQTHTHTPGVPT